jgi:prepilin-type N-terminal cleavage/methylation domain-containing protein
MKRVQQGFTLIELMIVIAIVAILVALAVPAYQDYTIRSKVAECVNSAAPAKLALSEFLQTNGAWPTSRADSGISDVAGDSEFCDVITYTSGNTYQVSADETVLGVTGTIIIEYQGNVAADGRPVEWLCFNAGTADNAKYLPSTCRTST